MPDRRAIPRSFRRLTAACTVGAAAAIGLSVLDGGDLHALSNATFWLLVALTLGCRAAADPSGPAGSVDLITVASPFALAILFLFGGLPAMLTWLVVAFVADLIGGLGPVKGLFNAAQYTISMGAATVALDLGGGQVPLTLVAETCPRCSPRRRLLRGQSRAGRRGRRVPQRRAGAAVPADRPRLPVLDGGLPARPRPAAAGRAGRAHGTRAVPVLAIYLGGRQAAAAAYQATHDALTRLPNRPLLLARSPTPWVAAAPARGRGWPWWISTTSSRSTTRSDTMPATSCCSASPSG
jgi:hypothetical protein